MQLENSTHLPLYTRVFSYHNTTRRILTNNRNICNPLHSPSLKALWFAASAAMSHNTIHLPTSSPTRLSAAAAAADTARIIRGSR